MPPATAGPRRRLADLQLVAGVCLFLALAAPMAGAHSSRRSEDATAVTTSRADKRLGSDTGGRWSSAATRRTTLALRRPHLPVRGRARHSISRSEPVSSVASERFGLSIGGHVQNLPPSELARELDGYRSAGARWVRVDINWHVIQREGRSSFNWAPFDNVVRGARDRGLKVLGVLEYTPPWARGGVGDPATPPLNVADYASFAAGAVRHYAPMGVRHWEIWNEPNIPEFWSSGPNAAAYTALLRAAYPAIKQADPGATVVSGGLSAYGAYGQVSPDGRINPLTFLERMYASGAAGHFDALGYHPYNFPGGLAFHPASGWSQMVATRPSVRAIMEANGDASKRVWATEFGVPTRGGRAITEEEAARLVRDSYSAFGSYGWAGPLFWYSFRDLGSSGSDRDLSFGLVRSDFSPKRSFATYQQAAQAADRR